MFSEGLSVSSGSLMPCDADMLLVAFGASAISFTEQFSGKDFYSVWKAFVIDSEGCGYLGQRFPGKCRVKCCACHVLGTWWPECWPQGGRRSWSRQVHRRKKTRWWRRAVGGLGAEGWRDLKIVWLRGSEVKASNGCVSLLREGAVAWSRVEVLGT